MSEEVAKLRGSEYTPSILKSSTDNDKTTPQREVVAKSTVNGFAPLISAYIRLTCIVKTLSKSFFTQDDLLFPPEQCFVVVSESTSYQYRTFLHLPFFRIVGEKSKSRTSYCFDHLFLLTACYFEKRLFFLRAVENYSAPYHRISCLALVPYGSLISGVEGPVHIQ
ncbi:hypothetical protein BDF20DRAFT_834331 [Mycotypha africana]|uniref:uncharacterized protein n=1 Tax=Mycotypha africana TaxID=64632 RepID=UPI002300E9F5|nr:uncharacterized protein BDF20DRAFT_834331 [Mycotypha africana]KAI8981633.1 hypothetical protein BDF20DRAFT_834331 [Mycotypha africana]